MVSVTAWMAQQASTLVVGKLGTSMDSCTGTTAPLCNNRMARELGSITGAFIATMVRPSNEATGHWNGMRMANVTGSAVRQ